MMYAYGITQRGAYHEQKGTVCQDAHNIIKCGKNMVIAAVADGLGSEDYSDIASRIAVATATKHCEKNIYTESTDEDILRIICEAFTYSLDAIEKKAITNGHELDQYDTTLSLALLVGNALYYGHSGDSGIIALTTEGLYEAVTEQQRDEDSRVFPLFFGEEKWAFGKFGKPVSSVLLATDGIYEIILPSLLQTPPDYKRINIYVALAKYLMDYQSLRIEEIGEEAVKAKIAEFVRNIPSEQVNDDKTVVVVLNSSVEFGAQPEAYYAEPDWKDLKQKHDEMWRREAYPHLYSEQPTQSQISNIVSGNSEQINATDTVEVASATDGSNI